MMKRLAVVAIAAGLALAAPAVAQRESWSRTTEPFHIIDNLYYAGTEGLAVYVIKTSQGLIVIDGALPDTVSQVEASIARLGFRLTDVKIILNTHAHFDHSGGLAQLKHDAGAKLYAMEGDVSALEGGFYLGSETVKAMSAPPVKVDKVLHDGDTVTLGKTTLTANLTPGHTRGCTSWSFKVKDAGKRYDALIFCSATVAANRIAEPVQYAGIVEDYRKTFARARTMKVDVPLAPHPEFFDELQKAAKARATPKGPNPFIAPDAFQPFIADAEADFEQQLKRQAEAAKAKPADKRP